MVKEIAIRRTWSDDGLSEDIRQNAAEGIVIITPRFATAVSRSACAKPSEPEAAAAPMPRPK